MVWLDKQFVILSRWYATKWLQVWESRRSANLTMLNGANLGDQPIESGCLVWLNHRCVVYAWWYKFCLPWVMQIYISVAMLDRYTFEIAWACWMSNKLAPFLIYSVHISSCYLSNAVFNCGSYILEQVLLCFTILGQEFRKLLLRTTVHSSSFRSNVL